VLIKLVNCIGTILQEEGINAKIDFDHRDGMVIIKYRVENEPTETVCVIDDNTKAFKGFDASQLWMPDYNKAQKVNRKIITLLEKSGYCMA